MSEMVERVARAIYEAVYGQRQFQEAWPDLRKEYRDQIMAGASAAIAAMREPTEAQYEALSNTGKMWRDLDSRTVWQTYIDAALGGEG